MHPPRRPTCVWDAAVAGKGAVAGGAGEWRIARGRKCPAAVLVLVRPRALQQGGTHRRLSHYTSLEYTGDRWSTSSQRSNSPTACAMWIASYAQPAQSAAGCTHLPRGVGHRQPDDIGQALQHKRGAKSASIAQSTRMLISRPTHHNKPPLHSSKHRMTDGRGGKKGGHLPSC